MQSANFGEDSNLRNFGDLWVKAEQRYKKETKKDLRTLPIVKEFLVGREPPDVDKVFELLKRQNKSFETFRDRGSKVLNTLKPIVNFVLFFLDKGADVVSVRPHRYFKVVRSLNAQTECDPSRRGCSRRYRGPTRGTQSLLCRLSACSRYTGYQGSQSAIRRSEYPAQESRDLPEAASDTLGARTVGVADSCAHGPLRGHPCASFGCSCACDKVL